MVNQAASLDKVALPVGPVEAPSSALIDEVLLHMKAGGAKDWKDLHNSRGEHVISQREHDPSSDDRKVLQEVVHVDENDKTKSHFESMKNYYRPGSETLIGWDSAKYRHDHTLQSTSQWRDAGTDANGKELQNRYHSADFAADGKTKTKERDVNGLRDTHTLYEADGHTPKKVDTLVRTDPKDSFTGNRTIEEFKDGSMVFRKTSFDKSSGKNELLLTEKFRDGVLTDKGFPITDPDGRTAWRHEFYTKGQLSGWEDSTTTADKKDVLLSNATVKDGHVTDAIKYNYIVLRPDAAWYQSATMPLDATVREIPAGATVPSYTHIKFDTTKQTEDSTRIRDTDGNVSSATAAITGRPIFEETISRGQNIRRLSWKEIEYENEQPVIKSSGSANRNGEAAYPGNRSRVPAQIEN